MRYFRRKNKRSKQKLKKDPQNEMELDLIQAYKDEDYIRCVALIQKIVKEGLVNNFIEVIKPKILEKLNNENININ